jgi:hypothetical protein
LSEDKIMKKNLFFATMVAIFAGAVASAQSHDRFTTEGACTTEVKEGTAVWYQPSFFDHRNRAPARPVSVTRQLEQRACAEMWIVGGWAWVPQPGTPQLAEKAPKFDFDVNGVIIRRSDCGNSIRRIVYVPVPPPPAVVPSPKPTPTPAPEPEYGCVVLQKETANHVGDPVTTVGQVSVFVGDQWKTVPYNGVVRFDNVPVGYVAFGEKVPYGYVEYLKTPITGKVKVAAGEDCAGVILKNRQLPPPVTTHVTVAEPPSAPTVERGRRKWPWVLVGIGGAVVAGTVATRGGHSAPPTPPGAGKPSAPITVK